MGWFKDWFSGKKKKKPTFIKIDSERSSTDEFLQILIGNPGKVKPKIVFKRVSADKKFLGLCCVWGYGPVANKDSVDVYLDDVLWTNDKFKKKEKSLVQVQTFTGLDNQQSTSWNWFKEKFDYSGNNAGRGVVYSLIALTLDGEIFENEPQVFANISNKVPIVNDGSERSLLGLTDIDNPALIASWFLRDPVAGYGFPNAVIGDSFETIRGWINENKVQQYADGPLVNRFSANGVLKGKKDEMFEAILDSFYAKIVFVDGKFEINFKGYNTNPVMVLDESNTTKHRTTFEGIDKEERFNRVIVSFTNPELNHEIDQAIYPEIDSPVFDAWIEEDNGILQEEEIELKLVNNYYEALEQAKVLARESRESTTYKIKGTAATSDLIPYDSVAVNDARKGWDHQLFYVEAVDVDSDESEEYELELTSFNPTIYDWLDKDEYTPSPVVDDVDLSVIGPPTNLAFDLSYQALTWTAPVESISAYEVSVYSGIDSDSSENYLKTVTCSTEVNRFDLAAGVYTFVVKAFGVFGISHAEITVSVLDLMGISNLAFSPWTLDQPSDRISFSHNSTDVVGEFVVSIKDSMGNVVQTHSIAPRDAQEAIEFTERIKSYEG